MHLLIPETHRIGALRTKPPMPINLLILLRKSSFPSFLPGNTRYHIRLATTSLESPMSQASETTQVNSSRLKAEIQGR